MKFCQVCGTIMSIRTDTADILWVCPKCATMVPGTDEDTLISGDIKTGAAQVDSQQEVLLEQIAWDPTAFKIFRDCPCGMDYLTQACLNAESDMKVVTICICGRINGEFP